MAARTLMLPKADVVHRKLHKFSPPAATALYPKNMISFDVNQFSKKLSVISVPLKFNILMDSRIKTTSFNILCSSVGLIEEKKKSKPFVGDHQLNINTLSDSSCSSNSTPLFSVSQVFDTQKMVGRVLVLLLYGLLGFMGMFMFQNSAFAASYGRMGGSSSPSSWSGSSSSSSSSPSSWSGSSSSSSSSPSSWSGSSSYWSSSSYSCCSHCWSSRRNRTLWSSLRGWWTKRIYSCVKCNCRKVGRKRYKCACRCHYKNITCYKCVSSTSTTPCTDCNCNTKCTCICHNKLETISTCTTCNCNSQLASNCTCNCHKIPNKLYTPCTNCNCNKEREGNISRRPFLKNRRRNKRTCTCNCHNRFPTSCWCEINEEAEKFLSALADSTVSVIKRVVCVLLAFYISTHVVALISINDEEMDGENGSVLMLQVGVLDKRRELQMKLNRIAKIADTSSLNGLNFVLKGVVNVLLQHYASCHFAYIFVEYDKTNCKQCFNKVLNRELGRYSKEEETLANVNGIKHKTEAVGKACSSGNDYAVVTLLVHVSGKYSIPFLKYDVEHVKDVLQNLEWIPKSKIKSVEVMWTPQKEDEVISEKELRRDFELLKPVNLSENLSHLNQ